MKPERKEFKGSVLVTSTKDEVRVWVCKDGINIFRFKAIGKVYKSEQDITVIGGSNA